MTPRLPRSVALPAPLAALALVLLLGGCQLLWASITSPSDWVLGSAESISGSIRAISRSSGIGGGGPDAAYRRDVRAWTVAFTRTGGSQEDFLRGLARVAEPHGVTHWEGEPATLVAIGEGLRAAGATPETLEGLLAGTEPPAAGLVREGFRGAGG